jgi:putative endonuclease
VADGFTKKDRLKRLACAERHDTIRSAIQREKNMKHWPRAWKIELILSHNPNWQNPNWDNLFDRLV